MFPNCISMVKDKFAEYIKNSRNSVQAQRLKRLPPVQETRVRYLGREDPLEKEMATHSSILAWRIPWMEEHGGPQSTGRKESDTTERLHLYTFTPMLFLRLIQVVTFIRISASEN